MRKRHGFSKTKEHFAWRAMRARCNYPGATHYDRYGGRGIKVCGRWDDFTVFLADMGPRPEGATLDRIDNDSDYGPGNCRWATRKEQSNNRFCNKRVTYNDETLTLAQWAERTGINYVTLLRRYNSGLEPKTILSQKKLSSSPHNPRGGAANGKKQRAKTHCSRGHERTPENIYVLSDKSGRTCWHCKPCMRIRSLVWREKRKAKRAKPMPIL